MSHFKCWESYVWKDQTLNKKSINTYHHVDLPHSHHVADAALQVFINYLILICVLYFAGHTLTSESLFETTQTVDEGDVEDEEC